MTIFDALKRDHDAIKALLPEIDPGHAAAKDKLDALKTLVIVHSRAEEDTFYAALEEFDETEARAEHSVEEHQQVESMLNALSDGDIGSAAWRATFDAMKTALLRHIRDEQDALFKQAKALLTESDLARLSAAFVAEKQRLLATQDGAAKKTASG